MQILSQLKLRKIILASVFFALLFFVAASAESIYADVKNISQDAAVKAADKAGSAVSNADEEPEAKIGIIKSVSNKNTGIRVTWSKDLSKSGYYIYRKPGTSSSSWVKIKTISDPSKTFWLDKSVKNGVKYLYKVKSFNEDSVAKTSKYLSIYRLTRPEITKINAPEVGMIYLKSKNNKKATGYQVSYSKNKSFVGEKTINISGTRVDREILNLDPSSKYYFRIRSYIVKNGKTYYSNWSKRGSKKTKAAYNVYTTDNWTYLFKKTNASSQFIRLWYNTKLKYLGTASITSSGEWVGVKYSSKKYYVWIPNGVSRLTKVKNKYKYTSDSNTKLENEVVKKAVNCLKSWDMKYDYTHSAEHGVPDSDGRYPFDCSNFAAYVINSVMTKYCPGYNLSTSVLIQSQTDIIVNEGLPGEIGAVKVCEGKLDRSSLRPGDLLYFKTDPSDERIVDHVGIFLGGDEIIHSVKNYQRYPGDTLGGVAVAPLKGYNESTFVFALRVISDKTESAEIQMIADKATNVYSNFKCKAASKIDNIPAGTEVTVMYVLNREYTDPDGDISLVLNAYVRYGDGKYGFIYNYDDKLSAL